MMVVFASIKSSASVVLQQYSIDTKVWILIMIQTCCLKRKAISKYIQMYPFKYCGENNTKIRLELFVGLKGI